MSSPSPTGYWAYYQKEGEAATKMPVAAFMPDPSTPSDQTHRAWICNWDGTLVRADKYTLVGRFRLVGFGGSR